MYAAMTGIEAGLVIISADALTTQYQITYKRANKPAKIVQVGCARGGVKLHASAYAPQ